MKEFKCRRCGNCCRWPGAVKLEPGEAEKIAAFLNMPEMEFFDLHTRLTPDRRHLSLIEKTDGSCEYLTADGIGVPHCFTTRLGGVSEGHLASMNIGIHRGDKPENVMENYRILGNALGFSPEQLVLTTQTHTDKVLQVGREQQGAGLFSPELEECDGLITCQSGVGLVVFTADCTPILLHDPVTGAVGAVHAGWRGTAAAIGAKAVAAMVAPYRLPIFYSLLYFHRQYFPQHLK